MHVMKKIYKVRCPKVPPGYQVIYSGGPDSWEAFAITHEPGRVHVWRPRWGWSDISGPLGNDRFWEMCVQWASEHEVYDEQRQTDQQAEDSADPACD